MGILDHLTCLLRNLYSGQEATDRTLYGTTDWVRIEKGVWKGCLLSLCWFNVYVENIMRNARLDELQAGIMIGRRNINNVRDVDQSVQWLSHVRLFATPWTVAYQRHLSMGFSRQEYWSGLPFPSPGDLPDPGIELGSPVLQAFYPLSHQGSPLAQVRLNLRSGW